tara:strand:+ start:73305 stop:73457 length:153 start_codon:yes stop_codon:yes gene_type:complete
MGANSAARATGGNTGGGARLGGGLFGRIRRGAAAAGRRIGGALSRINPFN